MCLLHLVRGMKPVFNHHYYYTVTTTNPFVELQKKKVKLNLLYLKAVIKVTGLQEGII